MIHTVIQDCYELLKRQDGWLDEKIAGEIGRQVSLKLQKQFESRTTPPKLRLSSMGPRCPRALWYSINRPELAEPLPPEAVNKYAYGNIVEAWTIGLIKATGKHSLVGEQDAIEVDGVTGHRDCIIDGCLVDIKSASSISFQKKFKEGGIAQDDPFGYLDQLDAYVVGSSGDPRLETRDRAFILAVDKTLGKMILYEHTIREKYIRERIEEYKRTVELSSPPTCRCRTEPDGQSGNIKLGTTASYSAYKHCCFPNLRTFLYSSGPRYLTKVVRLPDVPEV